MIHILILREANDWFLPLSLCYNRGKDLKENIFMNAIKNLSKTISRQIRVIILVILLAYVIVTNISNLGAFLPALERLVPLGLIIFGIIYLMLNKKEFAAHATLLFGFFLSAGTNFVNSILSLRFEPFGLANPLSVESFLELFGFIYLTLMVISLFLNKSDQTKSNRKDLVLTTIIAGLFFYLRGGLFLTISKLLLPVISLFFGLPLATILFLAAGVIDVPFDFINTLLNVNLLTIPLSYYLFSLFAFYLIYGAIKGILGEMNK